MIETLQLAVLAVGLLVSLVIKKPVKCEVVEPVQVVRLSTATAVMSYNQEVR